VPYYSQDRLVCILPIVKIYRGGVFVGEYISYSVCGVECYFEFCLSEEDGKVGSILAYTGVAGPLLLGYVGVLLVLLGYGWGVYEA